MSEIQFKKGDRVWSVLRRQWGTVDRYEPDREDWVWVQFDLTKDLAVTGCDVDELFFKQIHIPESARTRPTPKHEFKPGDVVLAEGFEGQPELRVFVRFDVGGAVLRNLGTPSYDYEQALSRVKPYDRTLLGFDAVEEIRLGESKIRPVFTVEEGDNG